MPCDDRSKMSTGHSVGNNSFYLNTRKCTDEVGVLLVKLNLFRRISQVEPRLRQCKCSSSRKSCCSRSNALYIEQKIVVF